MCLTLSPSSVSTSDADISFLWTHTSLLNTQTYIASSRFGTHVTWSKSGNQNYLVYSSSALDDSDSPSLWATCAIVGTVSPTRLYLEPHGNYNPNFERTALETSKIQFQLVAPSLHWEFEDDFNHGTKILESLQKIACKERPGPEHFVVNDGGKRALKISSPLFEKRVIFFLSGFLKSEHCLTFFLPSRISLTIMSNC